MNDNRKSRKGADYLQAVLKKYEAGECSKEELDFIDEWYNGLNESNNNSFEEEGKTIEDIMEKMWANILPELKPSKQVKHKLSSSFFLSCSAIFVVGVCFLLWSLQKSSGKKVTDYTVISSQGDIQKIVLPDSTIIWLNSNSTLKYATEFQNNRTVYLTEGEAFFTVVHDAGHPFKVYMPSGITVEDLGTEFDIKSYPNLNILKIRVLEGKVAVDDSATTLAELSNNEALSFDKTYKKITKTIVDKGEVNGWLKGMIVLNNSSFDELALALENTYKVSLKYKEENLGLCHVTMSFKATDKLKDLMDDLALIYKFTYTIDKNQVLISGKGCT